MVYSTRQAEAVKIFNALLSQECIADPIKVVQTILTKCYDIVDLQSEVTLPTPLTHPLSYSSLPPPFLFSLPSPPLPLSPSPPSLLPSTHQAFCQLIKQTAGLTQQDVDSPNVLSCWQMLGSMCCSFVPERTVKKYLVMHLNKFSDFVCVCMCVCVCVHVCVCMCVCTVYVAVLYMMCCSNYQHTGKVS